jgi:hypothetical protein
LQHYAGDRCEFVTKQLSGRSFCHVASEGTEPCCFSADFLCADWTLTNKTKEEKREREKNKKKEKRKEGGEEKLMTQPPTLVKNDTGMLNFVWR